jgi:hypothetical protein
LDKAKWLDEWEIKGISCDSQSMIRFEGQGMRKIGPNPAFVEKAISQTEKRMLEFSHPAFRM